MDHLTKFNYPLGITKVEDTGRIRPARGVLLVGYVDDDVPICFQVPCHRANDSFHGFRVLQAKRRVLVKQPHDDSHFPSSTSLNDLFHPPQVADINSEAVRRKGIVFCAAAAHVEDCDGVHSVGHIVVELRDQVVRLRLVFRRAGSADAPYLERLGVQEELVPCVVSFLRTDSTRSWRARFVSG